MQHEKTREASDRSDSAAQRSNSVAELTSQFCLQIEALRETAYIAYILQSGLQLTSAKEHSRLFEQYFGSAPNHPEIPASQLLDLMRLTKRLKIATASVQNTLSSFFVGMVSQLDSFIGGLYRNLVAMKPEVINNSQRTFTFSDIKSFKSIEDARDFLLDEEIETLLRESHHQQLKQFEKKFGVNLSTDKDLLAKFVEITQRRNLCVHSSTRISRQYVEVCKDAGFPLDTSIEVGKSLSVDIAYILMASQILMELAVKMSYILWVKVDPSASEAADAMLIDIGYDLIVQEDYDLAKRIWDFSCSSAKRHSTEEVKYISIVNRAQVYKWSGDELTCSAILNELDFSAAAYKFQLAAAVLREDYSLAVSIMHKIGSQDANMKLAYRIWPLFQKARKEAQFTDAFRTIFSEDLDDAGEVATTSLVKTLDGLSGVVRKQGLIATDVKVTLTARKEDQMNVLTTPSEKAAS